MLPDRKHVIICGSAIPTSSHGMAIPTSSHGGLVASADEPRLTANFTIAASLLMKVAR